VTTAPFEDTPDAEIAGRYDTVLTSPPFYDQELYEGDRTSTTRYGDIEAWYAGFYRPLWRKAAVALRPGGRVIAYVSGGRLRDEADAVLREAGLSFVGAVGFRQAGAAGAAGAGPVRDAYIWRLQ
jgi:hypothetical protein